MKTHHRIAKASDRLVGWGINIYTIYENCMNYSEIVSITRERNRPSGGIKTVHEVVVNAMIQRGHKTIEIGSNTGFTSVNIALLTGSNVVGIDTIDKSVDEAQKYAKENHVSDKVSFVKASALNIPFGDEYFDFVWASNVTSFIDEKKKAFAEYLRVLKNGGILIVVPIYYFTTPPDTLVAEVSSAIGSKIQVWDKEYWMKSIESASSDSSMALELIYESSYRYDDKENAIGDYVEEIFSKEHLRSLGSDERKELATEYEKYIRLFNENLKYAQYSVLLFQKRGQKDEVELFTTNKLNS